MKAGVASMAVDAKKQVNRLSECACSKTFLCSVFFPKDAIFTSAGIFERSNLAAPDSASLGIDSTKHL